MGTDLSYLINHKIPELRDGLSAVVQEGYGHWAESYHGSRGTDNRADDVWVVDQERIDEPDLGKRETAKAELEQIYSTSEWHSARYIAGKALGKKDLLGTYVGELEEALHATKVEVAPVVVGQEWLPAFDVDSSELVPIDVYGTKPSKMPDVAKRSMAVEDAAMLYKLSQKDKAVERLLVDLYKNSKSSEDIWTAGEALGYSRLKIWWHNLWKG